MRCPKCDELCSDSASRCSCGHVFEDDVRSGEVTTTVMKILGGIMVLGYLTAFAQTAWGWPDWLFSLSGLLVFFLCMILPSGRRNGGWSLGCVGVVILSIGAFFGWAVTTAPSHQEAVGPPALTTPEALNFRGVTLSQTEDQLWAAGIYIEPTERYGTYTAGSDLLLTFSPRGQLARIEGRRLYSGGEVLLSADADGAEYSRVLGLQKAHQLLRVGRVGLSPGLRLEKTERNGEARLALAERSWPYQGVRYLSINKAVLGSPEGYLSEDWGRVDRSIAKQTYTVDINEQVDGLWGHQLELEGKPLLTVGDTREKARSVLPELTEDGYLADPLLPLGILFEQDRVAGIGGGRLQAMAHPSFLPAGLLKELNLSRTGRVDNVVFDLHSPVVPDFKAVTEYYSCGPETLAITSLVSFIPHHGLPGQVAQIRRPDDSHRGVPAKSVPVTSELRALGVRRMVVEGRTYLVEAQGRILGFRGFPLEISARMLEAMLSPDQGAEQ